MVQAARSLSHGGIEYRPYNGEFSVMSHEARKGTLWLLS